MSTSTSESIGAERAVLVGESSARGETRARELVREASPGALAIERVIAALVIGVPAAGTAWAIAWTAEHGRGGAGVVAFAMMYVLTVFGVTIGYHRLSAHRSFVAHPVVRAILIAFGSMALQGPVIRWASDHRRHHALTEREGDPHSPWRRRVAGRGGRWRDFWHAHWGWLFGSERTRTRRLAPDLIGDPLLRALDRLYLVWVMLSFALPMGLGALVAGDGAGAIAGLLWGGFARIFAVHHVTWCINSLCHLVGSRPFRTNDESRNNLVMAVLALGEGWHNNHHAFPGAADMHMLPGQVDVSGLVIRGLARVGLAREVRRPSPQQVARLRA